MTLPEKLVELHEGLEGAGVPHAFGGAIALAYWTLDPRGTGDIDVNVFVPSAECERALGALPAGIAQPQGTAEVIARDGQTRLWWEETPVDLFFDYVAVHAAAARNARTVPFAGTEIQVLGPVELAIFKAMFDRTRDWADIEAMIGAGTLDLDAVRETLATLVDGDDPRYARLEEAERRAGGLGFAAMSARDSSRASITGEGLKALRVEIAELEGPARNAMAARIKAARELGDLKENADYHIAKEDQAHLETRIKRLRQRLAGAEVVEVDTGAPAFAFGRTAEVLDEGAGSVNTWTLVGSTEANLAEGMLSVESPIGRALRDRAVGDAVAVETPKGERVFRVQRLIG